MLTNRTIYSHPSKFQPSAQIKHYPWFFASQSDSASSLIPNKTAFFFLTCHVQQYRLETQEVPVDFKKRRRRRRRWLMFSKLSPKTCPILVQIQWQSLYSVQWGHSTNMWLIVTSVWHERHNIDRLWIPKKLKSELGQCDN